MKVDSSKNTDKVFGIELELITMLLVPAAATILVVMWVLLVLFPKLGQISDSFPKFNQLASQEKMLLSRKSYYLAIDEEELRKNSEMVSRALLKENNAYYLVQIIRKISSKFDFVVQSFSVSIGELNQEEGKSATFSKIPVSLVLAGPKNRYLELIKALERSLPLLSLESFEQRNTTSGLSELTLMVSSYYLKGRGDLDVAKLGVAELTLKKDELDVLGTLAGYEIVGEVEGLVMEDEGSKKEYFKVERRNPFNF